MVASAASLVLLLVTGCSSSTQAAEQDSKSDIPDGEEKVTATKFG
jgi:uncharacterized protein YcfL